MNWQEPGVHLQSGVPLLLYSHWWRTATLLSACQVMSVVAPVQHTNLRASAMATSRRNIVKCPVFKREFPSLELGVYGLVAHCTCVDTRSFYIRAHPHTFTWVRDCSIMHLYKTVPKSWVRNGTKPGLHHIAQNIGCASTYGT